MFIESLTVEQSALGDNPVIVATIDGQVVNFTLKEHFGEIFTAFHTQAQFTSDNIAKWRKRGLEQMALDAKQHVAELNNLKAQLAKHHHDLRLEITMQGWAASIIRSL